ncbi:Lipoate-protein ligase B [Aphelenchoides fujianensis]|nr:Lipoate-protein ligase B [Aphelenchoides fujianensis]
MLRRLVSSKVLSNLPALRSSAARFASSKEDGRNRWEVETLADGTIACWHPEKPFPFEHSRPIDAEWLARDRAAVKESRERRRANAAVEQPEAPKNVHLREIFHVGKTEFKTRHIARRTPVRDLRPAAHAEGAQMIAAVWFGRRSFAEGLRIQEALFQFVRSNSFKHKHFLCLVEHSPVYTVGLRDHVYTAEKERELRALGADFQRIKRGGLITFHGPGQLVAYPILNLRALRVQQRPVGVKKCVELIEETIIRLSRDHFDVPRVARTENPGVWVDGRRKLAAIGLQVRAGITSHGLALNCDTDMKWFEQIVPCGLEGMTATSLSLETGRPVGIADALQPLVRTFGRVFELETSLLDSSETPFEDAPRLLQSLGE